MSFLYPLFLAGIAAIGLPILAHMIRSKTRKRVTFSSLMFVPVTLPRFRNRSRIEHVLLLILRCAIVCLLAFAFSRPFFQRPVGENHAHPARRIVLLIDTSASMRRTGAWGQAIGEARSVLNGSGPADRLCVMSFDRGTRTLIGFDQWRDLEPARRTAVAAEQISRLSPGWAGTDLGHALVVAAEAIEDDEVNDAQQVLAVRQVVLISDLQQGGNLESLHAYEWPEQIELVVRPARCRGATNAAIQLLADGGGPGGSDDDGRPRVRVSNSSDAATERFRLNWADETSSVPSGHAADVYVPPGHSVVARAPARTEKSAARKLILTGDDQDFDNTLYLAPSVRQQVNILYVGSDEPNDPAAMLYYLRKVFGADVGLESSVIRRRGGEAIAAEEIDTAHLIVVAEVVGEKNLVSLRRYLESGRTLLLVADFSEAALTVAHLVGIDNLESEQANVDRYAMLGRIEFKHPIMAPFSEPRFGDFTRIHFWKYRHINITACPGAQVLARFDNNDPAWFEIPAGRGSLLVFACGWRPSDSDLALCSKFVPLFYSILEYGGGLAEQRSQYFVGDSVPMPRTTQASADLKIRRPDDSLITLDAAESTFTKTDLPGIYTIESSTGNRTFAVNLAAGESRTAPMPIEDIERLGVTFKGASGAALERAERKRYQVSSVEVEGRQKVWRWVLIAVLTVLLVEIWLAGWLTRPAPVSEGGQT